MWIKWLIVLHVLGAAIWVGGHLILCFRYLPESLAKKDPDIIRHFEKKYEPIGIPALLVQVVTGLWMALAHYNISLFGFASPIESTISIKLILLLVTVMLAIHVRLFLLPKLTPARMTGLAFHIVLVTAISVAMLYFGVSVRFGG